MKHFARALAIFAVVAGCTNAPVDRPASATGALAPSCTAEARYIVVAPGVACSDLELPASWRAAPLFADAPASPTEIGTCLLTSPRVEPPLVPGAAIITLAPPCDEPSVGSGEVSPLGQGLPVFAGSAGCDVCGVVKQSRMWLVLPPEHVAVKEFAVRLTNGAVRAFALHVADGVRAAVVTLPPPPEGEAYVDGSVTIY